MDSLIRCEGIIPEISPTYINPIARMTGISVIVSIMNASPIRSKVKVHGHRGARGHLPENTLPAFQYAIEAGADYLELDIGISCDGIPVINHDPWVNTSHCLNADGSPIGKKILIYSLSLNEIKIFDCGSLTDPHFPKQKQIPGTKIPTLEELFEFTKTLDHPNSKTIQFNIEIKSNPYHPEQTPEPEIFTEKVISVIRKSELLNRSMIQSFDPRILIASKKIEPLLWTAFLTEDPKLNLLEVGRKLAVNGISPHFSLLTSHQVQILKNAGFRVVPWTLNSKEQWKNAIEMNVDEIITDYPKELIDFLYET